MLRINILTMGSRGDVQPYLALGVGLKRAGHTVRLTTHDNFRDLIGAYGLDFFPIGGNIQDLLQGAAGQAAIKTRNNPVQLLTLLVKSLEPVLEDALENSWQSCQDIDLILSSATAFWGDDIAARLELPSVLAFLQPILPSRYIACPVMPPQLSLGPLMNLLGHQLAIRLYWQLFKPAINHWRHHTLGAMPHVSCPFFADRWQGLPKLFGYSPTVIPHPYDWDDTHHITGYWFLDPPSNFTPPSALLDFLAAGEAPVSIGFGSMASDDSEAMTEMAIAALKKTGQRGILLTGWGGISDTDLPDSIFKLASIPHAWLFPQMKAVVHHGGAGTTAAVLRAGVPGITVPFFADQPFWGDRVVRLGVSPQSIVRDRISVNQLADAIDQAINDQPLRQRAAQMGETIRAEAGLERAIALISEAGSRLGRS